MVLILSREAVEKVLTMSDCINVVEKGFGELASNKAVMPLWPTIHVDEHEDISKSQFDSLRRLLDSRGLIDEKLETVLRDIFRDYY